MVKLTGPLCKPARQTLDYFCSRLHPRKLHENQMVDVNSTNTLQFYRQLCTLRSIHSSVEKHEKTKYKNKTSPQNKQQ
jgi:hypothetical protein